VLADAFVPSSQQTQNQAAGLPRLHALPDCMPYASNLTALSVAGARPYVQGVVMPTQWKHASGATTNSLWT